MNCPYTSHAQGCSYPPPPSTTRTSSVNPYSSYANRSVSRCVAAICPSG